MKKYKPLGYLELKELIKDENIYLGDIDVSQIINMSDLFSNSNRKDFSGIETWDTSKVEDMSYMFYGCKSFDHPLNFDTSKVEDMTCMFYNCENFNQPLNFDTSKVEDMSGMFFNCKNLNQPLNFDTSKVKTMSYMFDGCENFNQPLNFDISNLEDINTVNNIFYDCFSLKNKKRKIILSID